STRMLMLLRRFVQIPIIFCDASTKRRNSINIRVDYSRGVRKLAAYLKDLGHRRVGIVGHDAELGSSITRTGLMVEAARSAGLQMESIADTDSLDGGRRA